jgi:hypothetical protein
MRKILPVIIFLTILTSCATEKLYYANMELPDKLGINLINSADSLVSDWEYFTTVTDSFITEFNLGKNQLKLYSTTKDSNSINIEIHYNRYVTKKQQVESVAATTAGILFCAALIAAEAPMVVVFWYNPKNRTTLSKSFSKDLDNSQKRIPLMIKTRHNFDSYEEQKVKQADAYYQFLNNLIIEVQTGKIHQIHRKSEQKYLDQIILEDGSEIKCEIVRKDRDYIYYMIRQDNRNIETKIEKEKVKKVLESDDIYY